MVQFLTWTLITLSLSEMVYLSPVLNMIQANDVMQEEDFERNVTNQLIDEIKSRILRSVDKVEAPKTHVLLPKLQTLSSGDELENQRKSARTKTITDFLYADVETISCNGQPCFKIHFNLLPLMDFQSAELWLYKEEGITEFSITHIISINEEETTTVFNQSHVNEWTRFDVSHMVNVENMTAFEFKVSTGCLGTEGDKKPFLLIHKEIPVRSISKRSASDCTNGSSTCCRQKYYIEFKDMGWSSWIIEPQGYEVNYCQGSCSGNIDLLMNHRARVMHALCENNPQKAREMNKTECVSCTPTEYRSISIIYLDEQDIKIVSHLPDMSVTKCGCA